MLKKLKGFGMSAQSCSALLNKFMKSPAHYALLWHSLCARRIGALTKQPGSSVSSEVLHRYRKHFVLSRRGSMDTQPAVAGGQELCHPRAGWWWHGAGNGFFWQQTPRKGLQCIDKKDHGHTGINVYAFCQYSLFFYKERKNTLS